MNDVTRVDQGDGRDEEVRILKKKRPQFGKIYRITLIDGELRLIGLHVAEVRIDSSVKDDAVLENGFKLTARRVLEMPRTEVGVERIHALEFALVLA